MATEEERKKFKQSHGLTVGEMENLAAKQAGMADDDTKKIKANNARKLKDRYFIEAGFQNYEVPDYEKHVFHIAQETRSFNGATGEKLSQAFVQKYDEQTFEMMKKNGSFNGQTIFILHDPRQGSNDKKKLEAMKQDETLGVGQMEDAPANRQRFAETQLHAGEGTSQVDPNPPARRSKVTPTNQEGTNVKGTKQAGGTEGQETTQNSNDVPDETWTVAELKEYADANGVEYASGATKADILEAIQQGPQGDGEGAEDQTPTEDWTVPELKEYAKDNGIELASDDAKADILKKIRKASR